MMMGHIEKEIFFQRICRDATNSSHFVCAVADLRYYQCANQWIFAYTQRGLVTLIALEPLVPGAPSDYTEEHKRAFEVAWKEFTEVVAVKIAAFASIYGPFANLLRQFDFQTLQIGQEPWIDALDPIPKGNAGKGVRSARNQALQAGLHVEEWSFRDLVSDVAKRAVFDEIYAEWKSYGLVHLSGFSHATDPFYHSEARRYFVIRSSACVEGYLIATPIGSSNTYYLEDIILRKGAPRGCGELITLEAIATLRQDKVESASLGVVVGLIGESSDRKDLSTAARLLLRFAPGLLRWFYDFDGLFTYRKRFKPREWRNVYIAVKPLQSGRRSAFSWARVFIAIIASFQPRFQITPRELLRKMVSPFRKHPLTFLFAILPTWFFYRLNHFGAIPTPIFERWGFFASAPMSEWIYRTVASDFLYADRMHFLIWTPALVALVFWLERTQRRRIVLSMVFFALLTGDIFNYVMVIKPFQFLHAKIFERLIVNKEVGASLLFCQILGFQICQFRKIRDYVFALLSAAMLLGLTALAAISGVNGHLDFILLNVNHILILNVGYLQGKLLLEYTRYRSRLVAKGKPQEHQKSV